MAWNDSNIFVLTWGILGQPTANHFLLPGCGPSNADEVVMVPGVACMLVSLTVGCRVAPGGAFVDTYTVRVNGVASAALATITAAAVAGAWAGAVAFTAVNRLSIQYTQTGGVATRDPIATLVFRYQD